MGDDNFRTVAVALAAAWGASALLALIGGVRAAATVNALVALAIGAATLPTLVAALLDRADYIRRYGLGAMHELPFDGAVLGLGVLAFALSLAAAIRRGRWLFLPGWLANAPAVVFAVYLAFWFHIF